MNSVKDRRMNNGDASRRHSRKKKRLEKKKPSQVGENVRSTWARRKRPKEGKLIRSERDALRGEKE